MGSLIGSYKSKELKKTMWSLEGVAEVNGKMFEFTTLRDERKISCTTNGQQVFEISLSIDSQDLLGDTDVIINVDAELNRLILMLIWGLR
jgi:hypothetical protein